MAKLRRLAALGAAAEAARRYAQKNPEKVREIAGKAAKFADQQTKGKYTSYINTAVTKAAEVAGVNAPAPVSPIRPVDANPASASYSPTAPSSSYTPPASSSQYSAPGSQPAATPPASPADPGAASGTPAPQRPKPTPFKRDA
ncbi:MAG TPA: antitoxin [Pseudonocardia sp.]|nr:antitoxin [Pseudonocardia sp.]